MRLIGGSVRWVDRQESLGTSRQHTVREQRERMAYPQAKDTPRRGGYERNNLKLLSKQRQQRDHRSLLAPIFEITHVVFSPIPNCADMFLSLTRSLSTAYKAKAVETGYA